MIYDGSRKFADFTKKYNLNIKKIKVHRDFYTNSDAFLYFLLYDVVKNLYQCIVEKTWCRAYYISSVFCTIIDTTRQRYILGGILC